jgi:hypothetical protein
VLRALAKGAWDHAETPGTTPVARGRDLALGLVTCGESNLVSGPPSYVADTIRAALPGLGTIEPNNVETLKR